MMKKIKEKYENKLINATGKEYERLRKNYEIVDQRLNEFKILQNQEQDLNESSSSDDS